MEQKNGNVVRRLVGYDRYDSRAALEALNRIYDLASPLYEFLPAGNEDDW